MKKLILIFIAFLGVSFVEGWELSENDIANYKTKCEARDSDACYKIGTHYSNQFSRSRDTDIQAKELMLKYYTRACNELRHGASCGGLASHYSITEKDEAKVLEFDQKGCDYKYEYSCTMLGYYYSRKARSEQDKSIKRQYESKARIAYKKACKLGSKEDCYR